METIARYAYQVYKSGSFTKAAKDLYISQPSLSAAISRLEKDLGFRIFDRATVPCSLTAEGRIYIESLEEIIESESNMRKRVKALSDTDHGSLTVGGASFASYLLLSEICNGFHKLYPKINVTVDLGNIGNLRFLEEKLEGHELDVLVTYKNDPQYTTVPLLEERVVIALHRSMAGAERLLPLALSRDELLSRHYSPDREIEDMSVFRDIEFLTYGRRSDNDLRMTRLLGNYRSSRYKIENARHSEMHYNLMCAGIGAVLTNTLSIVQKPYDENILFFVPKSADSYRRVFLAYNPSATNTLLAKRFIEVAKSIYTAE